MKSIAFFLLSGLAAGSCAEDSPHDLAVQSSAPTAALKSSSIPPTVTEPATTQPVIATTLPTTMRHKLTPPEIKAVSTAEKAVAADPRTAKWGKYQSVYRNQDGGYIVNFGTSYVGPRDVLVHEDKAEVQMAR